MAKLHYLFRPPENATELHRWTGKDWIPDDGQRGLAFSGRACSKLVAGSTFPSAFYPTCGHFFEDDCPKIIAQKYTSARYGCCNGREIPSKSSVLATLRKARAAERETRRKAAAAERTANKKHRLELWLRSRGIDDSLALIGDDLYMPLSTVKKLTSSMSLKEFRKLTKIP